MNWLVRVVLVLLVVGGVGFGQSMVTNETLHPWYYTVNATLDNSNTKVIVVQFPGRMSEEGIYADTLASTTYSKPTWWKERGRTLMWNGYLTADLWIGNNNLVQDSLRVRAFAIDRNGNLLTNDYVDCYFGTPPSYKTSQQNLAWTDSTWYRTDLKGAFGINTGGVAFYIDAQDETSHASNTDGLELRITVD